VEYRGKIKGDGKNNVIIGQWISFSKGSGWTSSIHSLPRLWSAHGKNRQTS
jgi:hypothetical protein